MFATPIVVAQFSFETGAEGWTIDGLWHPSTVRASQGSGSLRYADPATGNFDTGAENSGSLISPPIALGDFPVLTLDAFLDNECVPDAGCFYDTLKIYVSTDGGATYGPAIAYLPASNTGFVSTPIDLLAFANQTVVLRITFDTIDNEANLDEGAYVDNVIVTNMPELDVRPFPISLNADDDFGVTIPLHFAFGYQGAQHNAVYVSPRGLLTFGGEDSSSPSAAGLLDGVAKIAALWSADLEPENEESGAVTYVRSADSIRIIYDSVSSGASTNSFEVTLRANNTISITYGVLGATSAIVGLSPGGGVADPGEVDLSSSATHPVVGVVYEEFTGGGTDDIDLKINRSVV